MGDGGHLRPCVVYKNAWPEHTGAELRLGDSSQRIVRLDDVASALSYHGNESFCDAGRVAQHLIRTGRLNVSLTSIVLAGVALIATAAIYGLYALAEVGVRQGAVSRRDFVMLPGLGLVVTVIGLSLEWLDGHRPALVGGVGFAAFLGLNLGRLVWRARR